MNICVFLHAFCLCIIVTGLIIDKENNHSLINKDESPLISERLQEISNNLKQLISSTPLCIEMPPRNDTSSNIQVSANIVEPKTPDQSIVMYDKWEAANIKSPWETFNMRSSGMKVVWNSFSCLVSSKFIYFSSPFLFLRYRPLSFKSI